MTLGACSALTRASIKVSKESYWLFYSPRHCVDSSSFIHATVDTHFTLRYYLRDLQAHEKVRLGLISADDEESRRQRKEEMMEKIRTFEEKMK